MAATKLTERPVHFLSDLEMDMLAYWLVRNGWDMAAALRREGINMDVDRATVLLANRLCSPRSFIYGDFAEHKSARKALLTELMEWAPAGVRARSERVRELRDIEQEIDDLRDELRTLQERRRELYELIRESGG